MKTTQIKLSKKLLNMPFEELINSDYEDIKIEFTEDEAIQYISDKLFSSPEKVLALCLEDGLTPNDLDSITENDNYFEIGNRQRLIVTDEEAEEIWDNYLEQYIDDCVLCKSPKEYRNYFDNEAFKRDCQIDGRAHSLATYDGSEQTQSINGTNYYIYRTN